MDGMAGVSDERPASIEPSVAETFVAEPSVATFGSLKEDELLSIFAHCGFAALLCLKSVQSNFVALARRSLVMHFGTARLIYESLDMLHHSIGSRDVLCHFGSALEYALRSNDVATVEVLLCKGDADANCPLGDANCPLQGRSEMAHPLHFARSPGMVALLLEHGADLDARRINGMTPLMDACDAGEAAVVRALCQAGANVNARDERGGYNVLHFAEACVQRGTNGTAPWRCAMGSDGPVVVDGPGCVSVLREFGTVDGCFTRSDWYIAACDDLETLPDEYVPGFH